MAKAVVVIVGLIVFIPLLLLELPIIIQSVPKPILKIFCFMPAGAAAFLAVRSFLEGNVSADVISVLTCLLCSYGGFTLKNMID